MSLCKAGTCLLLAAAVLTTACGKQARTEAVQLAKVLAEKKTDFAGANAIEKELVASARAWCGAITEKGAGRGLELDQNAAVASGMARLVVDASNGLSQVRQALDAQTLTEEYPRSVRNTLMTQLTNRQRKLQSMRELLEQSATQFREYRQSKSYAGDSYPDGIGKLDAMLQVYRAPDDAVGTAIAALNEKYGLGGGK